MHKHLFLLVILFLVAKTQAQNVGIGTPTPNSSALLDLSSNNKGLLMPRMTSAQRNAIIAPAKGLMAFDSSQNSFWYYTGSGWKELTGNSYNSDSTLVVGQQVGSIASHNLTSNSSNLPINNSSLIDSSGYLYDSGGPLGNYGNNENFVYKIFTNYQQMATDIIVLSNNLESPYDSLIITDNYDHRYVLLGTTTGSYRLFGTVSIQIISNFANTLSGFAIRWNGVFPGINNNYDASQTTGWYYNPAKNYMRGGVNANNNWSPINSGFFSFAFGYNNMASGYSSTAMGNGTSASGIFSTAMGNGTTASGSSSTTLGHVTSASGDHSTAMGFYSSASGNSSTAIGSLTQASGNTSIAMGGNTTASGDYSTAMGFYASASGNSSTAIGLYTKSKYYGGLVAGTYNDSTNAIDPNNFNSLNRIFQIGNGTAFNARSNAMTVLQNGNIGIGELNPVVPLNFASSLGNKIALWGIAANHYGIGIQSNLMQFYSASNGDNIAFGYGNSNSFTENVRFNGNGNVGIGTTNPAYMLTVKNDINLDNSDANAGTIANALRFGGGSTGEAIGSNRTTATNQWGLDFYTNYLNRMAISQAGNVGIGTTAPSAKLSVNGSANNATGNWGVFSDARVKNITGNFTDGLNVISQITPVIFNYNDNAPFKTTDLQIGIVAQELEKIAPYMVSKQAYNQFADLREVNNQAYVFLLINAVKEQQEQIDKLEKLVKELSKKVN
jgi:hypothetical protein